jgi:hypothetical protein
MFSEAEGDELFFCFKGTEMLPRRFDLSFIQTSFIEYPSKANSNLLTIG